MDDTRIIELFWQRSEQAITEVDRKYGKVCRQIAVRLLQDVEDARECVNDAYHSLWNTIPPRRPEKLLAYAAKITRNLAMKRLTHHNAAKRTAATVSFEELGECVPGGTDPQSVLQEKELARAIGQFLREQNEQSRVIFLRRYWFFDSVAQIAAGLGLSQGAVKNRLYRMRKALKDYLEKELQIYVG